MTKNVILLKIFSYYFSEFLETRQVVTHIMKCKPNLLEDTKMSDLAATNCGGGCGCDTGCGGSCGGGCSNVCGNNMWIRSEERRVGKECRL